MSPLAWASSPSPVHARSFSGCGDRLAIARPRARSPACARSPPSGAAGSGPRGTGWGVGAGGDLRTGSGHREARTRRVRRVATARCVPLTPPIPTRRRFVTAPAAQLCARFAVQLTRPQSKSSQGPGRAGAEFFEPVAPVLGAAVDESAANLRAGRRAGQAAVSAPALGRGNGGGALVGVVPGGRGSVLWAARQVAWSPALLRPPAFPQPPRRSSRSDLLPPFPRSRAPISPALTRACLHKLLLGTKRVCGLAARPEVWPALRRPRPLQGNGPQTRKKSQLG